jgi:hypothetical protein
MARCFSCKSQPVAENGNLCAQCWLEDRLELLTDDPWDQITQREVYEARKALGGV